MGKLQITFTDTSKNEIKYVPQPATSLVPDWYKNTNSYLVDNKIPDPAVQTVSTIKKCMPVFDAMTAGYIIPTYVDLYVSNKDGKPYYAWPSQEPITFHENAQADKHPLNNKYSYPKWTNPWSIKTSKGYSCLFIQPMHQEKSFFKILPGIVDTDKYTHPVNFPFVLTDLNFEGIIPAGTPLVQVIPFKRDTWEIKFGGEKEIQTSTNDFYHIRSKFFEGYKSLFRETKSYK